jgi:hypothetical protein
VRNPSFDFAHSADINVIMTVNDFNIQQDLINSAEKALNFAESMYDCICANTSGGIWITCLSSIIYFF